ncbi:MAG: M23 family metallopeptidase [Chitinophagaceae bacterium]
MIKTLSIVIQLAWSLNVSAQLTDQEIMDRKHGRIESDTSYVYALPYEKSRRFLFIQGANSKMSHRDELSFDFKMKKGSKICAARDGIVIATKQDSDRGGLKDEFMGDGNHIIIRHNDGSTAHYWHLEKNGVFVKMGEMVKKNQLIGSSGNTGYTAFPHLHFQIIDDNGKEILPRFQTSKGVRYLRPGRFYKYKSSQAALQQ